ncbi:PREDICTED: pentatricopeptide repeat-containing protein At3g04130, mitochondrial isoform X2 [Nelumbo nucifera]|nr:PREDICTED: pentatricopeptide repeat-containing protein At3g04130, mitochondrial isoform X2 [Nelumbo nucifera]
MILSKRICIRSILFMVSSSISSPFVYAISANCSPLLSPLHLFGGDGFFCSIRNLTGHQRQCQDSTSRVESYLEKVVNKVRVGSNENEFLQYLLQDQSCCSIQLSDQLVDKLLNIFEDDWRSALGLFRWAGSRPTYKHSPEVYNKMVDILGKMKQMDRMWLLVEEMHKECVITLTTMAKVMRRLAGAGRWEDAMRAFDRLDSFGLEKNTESMNLLLDTLCKENNVELAREAFLKLKSHITPNSHTFNIFIHGWCKANKVDEAHWTIQEMKGHGCHPCVISYSTIILAFCRQSNFRKVYEILDEMEAQGCPPNIVTYTTIMYSLAKSDEFDEALQIHKRMKSVGCKPDTLFYNALIYILGRAGQVQDAVRVFEVDMPMNGVLPNSSTYNTMISMFCHHSEEQNALNILKQMEMSATCKPDLQTYSPLIKMCFKTGRTDGLLSNLLNDIVNKHHLSIDLSIYTLMIHGLCRANKCEWAYLIFEEMRSKEIIPRYQTCCLLLDEVKQKNMYGAADMIEAVMKQIKTCN